MCKDDEKSNFMKLTGPVMNVNLSLPYAGGNYDRENGAK